MHQPTYLTILQGVFRMSVSIYQCFGFCTAQAQKLLFQSFPSNSDIAIRISDHDFLKDDQWRSDDLSFSLYE